MLAGTFILPDPPRPGGLLAAALGFGEGDDQVDWTGGVQVAGTYCMLPERQGACSPGDGTLFDQVSDGSFDTVNIRQGVVCTALGRRDLPARYAQQGLTATLEYALSAELFDGLATSNPALEDAAVSFATTSVEAAVGCLEQYAAETFGGRVAYLHVPYQVASQMTDFVYMDDQDRWRTVTGNIVVFGSGYTGTSIYLSGPVYAAAATFEGAALSDVVRRTNRVEAWADTLAIVVFDPCTLAVATTGIEVCTPTSP